MRPGTDLLAKIGSFQFLLLQDQTNKDCILLNNSSLISQMEKRKDFTLVFLRFNLTNTFLQLYISLRIKPLNS